MTKQQQTQIERIRKQAENYMGKYSSNYEIKELEITEHCFGVALLIEMGRKNDEGTLASIYCRDRMMVFIGPKGGLRVPRYNEKLHKQVYRPYRSFIGACLDYSGR